MKNIVYRLTINTRKENNILPYQYIGSKSNCIIVDNKIVDDRGNFYFGSSSYQGYNTIITEEIENIEIEVLKEFNSYTDALNYESVIQKNLDVVADPTYFNLSIATVNNFTDPNYATYKHTITGKTVRLPRDHPKVISREYVGVSLGTNLSEEAKKKLVRSGEENHFYGKKHSEETKTYISNLRRKQGDMRKKESIDNWVENIAKASKSKEHRQKIGRKGMIMLKNIHTFEVIRIKREESHLYDSSIWMNPIKVKSILAKMEKERNES